MTLSPQCRLIVTGYDLEAWVNGNGRIHIENEEIVIGDYVWLCTGVTILPGVKITGKYVVVAAGAVVTRDITQNFIIVGGVPARIIKYLPHGEIKDFEKEEV